MQFSNYFALVCLAFGAFSMAKPIPDHAISEVGKIFALRPSFPVNCVALTDISLIGLQARC